MQAAITQCIGALPRLDILVNCAGIIRRGGEHDPEIFAEVIDINLTGTMRLCAAARPLPARDGGCIVNTSSVYSFFGGPHAPGYTASKGGVAQLTKSLAIAYAADKIRVNAVAPGWVATPLTQALQDDRDERGHTRADAARTLGQAGRRRGNVVFLCSPAASFITGADRAGRRGLSRRMRQGGRWNLPIVKAVRHLEAGEWKAAHDIVQQDES